MPEPAGLGIPFTQFGLPLAIFNPVTKFEFSPFYFFAS
jgi:hypothetical protein